MAVLVAFKRPLMGKAVAVIASKVGTGVADFVGTAVAVAAVVCVAATVATDTLVTVAC